MFYIQKTCFFCSFSASFLSGISVVAVATPGRLQKDHRVPVVKDVRGESLHEGDGATSGAKRHVA